MINVLLVFLLAFSAQAQNGRTARLTGLGSLCYESYINLLDEYGIVQSLFSWTSRDAASTVRDSISGSSDLRYRVQTFHKVMKRLKVANPQVFSKTSKILSNEINARKKGIPVGILESSVAGAITKSKLIELEVMADLITSVVVAVNNEGRLCQFQSEPIIEAEKTLLKMSRDKAIKSIKRLPDTQLVEAIVIELITNQI